MREACQHPYYHHQRHESRRGTSPIWFPFSPVFTGQICYSEVTVYCNMTGNIHNLPDPACDFIMNIDVRNNGTCLGKGRCLLAKSVKTDVLLLCLTGLVDTTSCTTIFCYNVTSWKCRKKMLVGCVWNVMAHAQKPEFIFRRKGRVHLHRRGRQFSRLLAAEVCPSAVVMLVTPCSGVVWRVLATHSIRQLPFHFPSRASPCAITFQLHSSTATRKPWQPSMYSSDKATDWLIEE